MINTRRTVPTMLAILLIAAFATAGQANEVPVVDVEFRDAEVLDIYQILGDLGGWNVVADQSVKGRYSLLLRSTPWPQALDLVAQATGFGYVIRGNTIVVASAQRLSSFDEREFSVQTVHHLAPEMAKSLIEASVPGVAVTIDSARRLALVNGTADQVQKALAVLAKYDVAPATEFDFVDQPVAEILRTLAKSAGINVIIEGSLTSRMTIYLKDMPGEEAIDLVATRASVKQEKTPEGVLILRPEVTKAVVTPEESESAVIALKHMPVNTALDMLSAAFPTLQLRAGVGGSFLVARGPDADLAAANRFIAERDFPAVRLTGLVQHASGPRALLDIAGRSYVVREGQLIDDILIKAIDTETVTICRGDRCEVLSTGGALK